MSRLGCLLVLLVVATAAYYGVGIGSVYFDYWMLQEEMRSQARLAPSIDDMTIRRRILRRVEDLNLPEGARKLTIRRTARPREIQISTTYHEVLELPFFAYTISLTASARQPL